MILGPRPAAVEHSPGAAAFVDEAVPDTGRPIVFEHCCEPRVREDAHRVYDLGEIKTLVAVHLQGDKISLIEELPRD